MAKQIPYKFYKTTVNGKPYVEILPGTNTPPGYQVTTANEFKRIEAKNVYSGGKTGLQKAIANPKFKQLLAGEQVNTGNVRSYTNPNTGEVLTNVPQSVIDNIEKNRKGLSSGNLKQIKPGVFVPTGGNNNQQQIQPPQVNLQRGNTGNDVKQLQKYLVSKGFMTQADMNTGAGIFGPRTEKAVTAMQNANKVDNSTGVGIYGPRTRAGIDNIQTSSKPDQTLIDFNNAINSDNPQQNVQDLLQQVEDFAINNVITPMVESGKTVNPTIIDKLPDINIEDFFKQAEKELAPFYKQKFDTAKQDLVRGLQNIGVDLGKELSGITRQSDQTRLSGREDLAGRGLTFSGKRNKFETNLTDATDRATERARTLAFRGAGDIGRQTERYTGTNALTDLNLPQVGGEKAFQLSSDPLIGTLQQNRRSAIQELGRTRAVDAAKRRALTFA